MSKELIILIVVISVLIVLIFALHIYALFYFKSEKFKIVKENVKKYVDDCNELNEHIEELKKVSLITKKTDYGTSTYNDKSKYHYQRKHNNKVKSTPKVYNCSRSVCDNSRKKPLQYLCKYFNIKPEEKDISKLEEMLNNYEAVENGKKLLLNERKKVLSMVKKEVPLVILAISEKILTDKIGFTEVNFKELYFPRYIFRYVSSGGNAMLENTIELNIDNLNKLIIYLSDTMKYKQSAAGQRALLTTKLRRKILSRDKCTCQLCGNSTNNEPNLLLEIDHIIPISKGGITTEDNLQVLCWRCNRKKSNKIINKDE